MSNEERELSEDTLYMIAIGILQGERVIQTAAGLRRTETNCYNIACTHKNEIMEYLFKLHPMKNANQSVKCFIVWLNSYKKSKDNFKWYKNTRSESEG